MKSRFILLLSALVLMTSSFSCGDSGGSENKSSAVVTADASWTQEKTVSTVTAISVTEAEETTEDASRKNADIWENIPADDREAIEETLNNYFEYFNSGNGEAYLNITNSSVRIETFKEKKSYNSNYKNSYDEQVAHYSNKPYSDKAPCGNYEEVIDEIIDVIPCSELSLEGAVYYYSSKRNILNIEKGYSVELVLDRNFYLKAKGYDSEDPTAPTEIYTEKSSRASRFSVFYISDEGWKVSPVGNAFFEDYVNYAAIEIWKGSQASLVDVDARYGNIGGLHLIHSDLSKNIGDFKFDIDSFYSGIENYYEATSNHDCEYFVIVDGSECKYVVVSDPDWNGRIETYPSGKIYNPETEEYEELDLNSITSVDEIYDKVKEHIH